MIGGIVGGSIAGIVILGALLVCCTRPNHRRYPRNANVNVVNVNNTISPEMVREQQRSGYTQPQQDGYGQPLQPGYGPPPPPSGQYGPQPGGYGPPQPGYGQPPPPSNYSSPPNSNPNPFGLQANK